MNNSFPHHDPLIIAHRGVSSRSIENSLRAFRLSVDNPWGRCDGVELDIHTSIDGEFLVHHDPHLRSGRRISALTASEARAELLPDGTAIPTLAEALAVLTSLRVYIEVKSLPPHFDQRLIEVVRSVATPGSCQFHSFDHRTIARLGMQAPDITTGVLSSSYPLDPIGPVLDAGASVLWQEAEMIDAELMEKAGAAGVEVIAWTVNSVGLASHLRRLGVLGLCGNWPERLQPGAIP